MQIWAEIYLAVTLALDPNPYPYQVILNTPVGVEIYQEKVYGLRKKVTTSSPLFSASYLNLNRIQRSRCAAIIYTLDL